jgi:hypothetical protein
VNADEKCRAKKGRAERIRAVRSFSDATLHVARKPIGRNAMPKQIEVTLDKITCDKNGFGGSIQLAGNIFGATFYKDPNVTHVVKVIYPFPSGPISVSQGETVKIQMDSVNFFLSSGNQEPPGSNPNFMKIGGELSNGLGSNFFTIDSTIQLPQDNDPGASPQEFDLTFSSDNLRITLGFGLLGGPVW